MTPEHVCAHAMRAKHAMVSYADPRDIALVAEICQSVVLDNGAFTAWKRGGELDIPGYLEWAHKWLKHPAVEWCLIPDKIDGDERENARLVRDWPLRREFSVPVWHMHESLEYLRWLCNGFGRVALGSSGVYSAVGTSAWWTRMADAMSVVCDEDGMPTVKLHGLRMLDPTVFSHIPLASADSTNVARNIGIDSAWTGAYSPASRATRAQIMMERIEQHASAAFWHAPSSGVQQNLALLG